MDKSRIYKVLICDLVGLKFDQAGSPDPTEVKGHIEAKGGMFHLGGEAAHGNLAPGTINFFYLPDISTEAEILPITQNGQYDAVIAAATFLPKDSKFALGGVRIGTGTGNMGSASWGGGNGVGGVAPLMNTPGFNARATAQMAMKALLRFLPDLPIDRLHHMSVEGKFDTGKNLRDFPTEKLEGKTMGIVGYGNIGREMALLASAFRMNVKVHARARHQEWIESEGFTFAPELAGAAQGADVLSVHIGLGPKDPATGKFTNEGLVSRHVLSQLNSNAVVLNFDRGECVDAIALGEAMATAQVGFAAIDADIFKADDGDLSGPLVPYLPLARNYGQRIVLLPHAAADTDHPSRVAAAKLAVDQIWDSICFGRVSNLKGDLPQGYVMASSKSVAGVGALSRESLLELLTEPETLSALRSEAEDIAGLLSRLSACPPEEAKVILEKSGKDLMLKLNRQQALLRRLGLSGPLR